MIRKFHEAKVSGGPVTLVGHRARRGASSCTSTTSPPPSCTCCGTYDSDADHQRGHRRGRHDPGAGRDRSPRSSATTGEVVWDTSKPDGTPRKLLDVSRLRALGWEPQIGLREGIASTYAWYLANAAPGL